MLVVTYEDRAHLALNTISMAVACGAHEVLLVTNGVRPAVRAKLERGLDELAVPSLVLSLPINTGSAGGFGAGIAAFVDRGQSDLLWILDDDNEPDRDALKIALEVQHSVADAAGASVEEVSVACFRPSDAPQSALAAGVPASRAYALPGSFNHFDLRQRVCHNARRSTDIEGRALSIRSAPYGGLLATRETLSRAGLPRSDFFLYEDDTEYTERFTEAGGHLVLAFDAVVHDPDKEPPGQLRGAQLTESATTTASSRPVVEMLRTPRRHRMRLYYQTRNTVHLDRLRARTAGARAWLIVNSATYLAAVIALAAVDKRNRAALLTFLDAVLAGLTSRLGRQLRYHSS